MNTFLIEALVFLAAAVVAVPVAKRLGLGSVLGYLIAGVVISPILQSFNSDTDGIQHFAEFGVVLMLFLVGLELEPKNLWRMRHRLMGLGGLQIVLTTLAVALAGRAFGLEWVTAIAVGLILAPSSTAIVLQTLGEKSLMRTEGGRGSFSILLFQDVAIIPIIALIPLLALPEMAGLASGDDHGSSHGIMDGQPGWVRGLGTLGAIGLVLFVGHYLTRPALRFIAVSNIREIFTAAALTLVIGIAVLMEFVGLSAALGTFLAGVVLATSEYRHELEADIEPFKGLLLGVFFITVGAGIDFGLLTAEPLKIAGITLGILAIKFIVIFGVAWMFKIHGQHRWLMALGLAQAGEFGFVLLNVASGANVVSYSMLKTLSLSVALTMLLTPLLFIAFDRYVVNRRVEEEIREADEIDEIHPVIIAGQGRFGQIVNRLLLSQNIQSVVLDHESRQIDRLRPFGIKAFFGDPTRPDLLHAAGLMEARVLVVAIDDPDNAIKLVEVARRARPDLHIVARASDRENVYALYKAGANDIVRELFDSSVRAGRYTLQAMGVDEGRAIRIADRFVQHDRHTLAELARLWNPEIPATANAEYIALAKKLSTDIGRAMEGLDVEVDDGEADGDAAEPSKS